MHFLWHLYESKLTFSYIKEYSLFNSKFNVCLNYFLGEFSYVNAKYDILKIHKIKQNYVLAHLHFKNFHEKNIFIFTWSIVVTKWSNVFLAEFFWIDFHLWFFFNNHFKSVLIFVYKNTFFACFHYIQSVHNVTFEWFAFIKVKSILWKSSQNDCKFKWLQNDE